MNEYNCTGPEDDYDDCELDEDDGHELDMLMDELMEDNDSWDRSNDEGWYYDDND